jgi:hypothetical protein
MPEVIRDSSGHATPSCLEPNLALRIDATTGGHLGVEISVVPEQSAERHTYKATSDQTFLPAIIRQCEGVLEKYPIREREQLGAELGG